MDVFAEAGRSEAIDAIVAVYEQRLRENARMLLEPLFPSERSEEIAERVEMMLLILQGTAVRTISNPAGDADRPKSAFRNLMTAIVQSHGSCIRIDRKTVVEGQVWTVRVKSGGRRIIK